MGFALSFARIACLALWLRQTNAGCVSYGTDFVNDGGPYCINTTSTDFFSFGTEFLGCQPSDSQGDITPILIDPQTNEYFCSDIPTTPDGKEMVSTCNLQGQSVIKSSMISGSWTIVIEGLTFAWMRVFELNAGPPLTFTSTPTATFTVTTTPTSTTTSTTTIIVETTIPAQTTTLPSTTHTKTLLVTPRPTTATLTYVLTRTSVRRVFTKTLVTVTSTTTCKTAPQVADATCTIHVKKASAAKPRYLQRRSSRVHVMPRQAESIPHELQARNRWAARSADLCTTTILQTSVVVSETRTETAPATTETLITDVTSTKTIRPPPSTVYSGTARVTITSSLPARTITIFSHSVTYVVITRTVAATLTSIIHIPPTGVACIRSSS